jgi:glycosyltransferase involved in cell wall biosynthesis
MRYNFVDAPAKPKTVTVITPTIGSPKVRDAVKSVQEQTYKHIRHLLVVDGEQYDEKFVENFEYEELEKLMPYSITPENTGGVGDGFYGHRIYAAYPHLVNTDYVMFLDEDNWYEPNHVESLIETIESQNLLFAYSLRKIYDSQGKYLINDDCESLGLWPIRTSKDEHLVDTSAYCFKRDFLIRCCHLWHHGWGGDRNFYNAIRQHAKHSTNGLYTLCYRLDGNEGSVSENFFRQGNEETKRIYKGKYPWVKI